MLRERASAFAEKLGLARFRSVPGLGWVIAIAAIALFIQAVGLANLIAVNDEKQQWDAAANQRQGLLTEIREIEARQLEAKKELHTLKGMIDHESGRLAEVQAGLKLTQQLRDEAQREQGAATNDAGRLRESSETIAARTKELTAQLGTTESRVKQLEADRDRLAAEVGASKKTLDEHRAEIDRAASHVKDLDAKAAGTLEAIRKSREAQVKAQGELDDLTKQIAKAAADHEAAKARLDAANEIVKQSQVDIDNLRKQQAALKTAIVTDKKAADEGGATRIAIDADLAAIKDKLDKANKTLAEKQGAAAAEESLVTGAQNRHDALKTRIANLSAELKPLEEQRLAIEADIAGKRKELETLRVRIDAAKTDLKAAPPVKPADPAPAPTDKPAEDKPKEGPK